MPVSVEEVAKRGIESFNREFAAGMTGIDAQTRALWVAEPVIVPLRAALEGNQYSGPAALEDFAVETRESWAWIRIEDEKIRVLDEQRALVVGKLRGSGRATGAETSTPIAIVCVAREGRIAEMHTYTSERDALAEAGR